MSVNAGSPAPLSTISPVLIIGTGLIGTSIGLSLRRAGADVALEDVVLASRDVAVTMGAGRPLSPSDSPALVVVAVPPAHAPAVLADASRRFPDATLTDVTSVKVPVLARAVEMGADPRRLIGGHPMAGREVSGPAGARVELMDDRVWILTPHAGLDDERLRQAHRLVTACGAYALEMTAEEHDDAVALVSHVPQLVSSALAGALVTADPEQVRIAGQGLRDTTRIAASQPALWMQILTANATPVAEVLQSVADDLRHTAESLRSLGANPSDESAAEQVEGILTRGVAGQARIPGKHGAAAAHYSEVEVMVADRPGELARLFVAAGDGGINLEDVRIEHVLGRPSGLVGLFVRPESAEALASTLRDQGFDVRT